MGSIKRPSPVKLFIGMIFNRDKFLKKTKDLLEDKLGAVDLESAPIKFDFTGYYEKEMGKNLLRQFISFKELITPSDLSSIKVFTNKTEGILSKSQNRRTINLDPGYITESSLVLATTKAFPHRIYLDKGIFAEVTLRYEKGAFKPYDWTYPDYRSGVYADFFKKARGIYKQQLAQWRKQKNIGA